MWSSKAGEFESSNGMKVREFDSSSAWKFQQFEVLQRVKFNSLAVHRVSISKVSEFEKLKGLVNKFRLEGRSWCHILNSPPL